MKKFLELSCNLPDFVERYRSLYLRLKNAMEELFGQQTAFVLALRQGFSAALLQLSILQAMHVSPDPNPDPLTTLGSLTVEMLQLRVCLCCR